MKWRWSERWIKLKWSEDEVSENECRWSKLKWSEDEVSVLIK